MNRRQCLQTLSALTVGTLLLPRWATASPLLLLPERSLSFYHLHTGEKQRVTYWAEGQYLPDSLANINHLLRDFRNDKILPIDTALLDQLTLLQTRLNVPCEFHIISAYRSPETNNMLQARSNGVAKRSMHLEGRAIDIRIPNVPLSIVRQQALAMKMGGVGYYPSSDFVHVDSGSVRQWGG
ncbi:DUF882 domain-containing protein [Moraxellaceae bacterium AER2_44_116]|nr:DUF882 domain-containing protein [Moraxellaceae bacterium]TQC99153.1 DUF882 domain-containing protein [Moraxellaceae bacterium AER2_44_116]